MTALTFDTLNYFEKLKDADVPEQQAKIHAAIAGEQVKAQHDAVQKAFEKYDESSRKELATKGDIEDIRHEIHDLRTELKEEIANTKHETLKWVFGIALAQTAVIVAVIGLAAAVIGR